MVQLTWGRPEDRSFEVGVDRGVFYPETGPGVAWNGLISVVESPEEAEVTPYYQDGIKTHAKISTQEYSSTLEAYTYPQEFEEYDGLAQMFDGVYIDDQPRRRFNLSYRTSIGDGIDGLKAGYKIHLLYNALALPSTKSYLTTSDTFEVSTFSWGLTSFPTDTPPGFRPSSHFIVDSRLVGPLTLAHLEGILYGTEEENPRLPTALQLFEHFHNRHILYPSSSTYPSSNTYPGGP